MEDFQRGLEPHGCDERRHHAEYPMPAMPDVTVPQLRHPLTCSVFARYKGYYTKRTNDRQDGCAIFW